MHIYRCYFLNADDQIQAFEVMEVVSLSEGIDQALAMLKARPQHRSVELWDGSRRVYPREVRERAPRSTAQRVDGQLSTARHVCGASPICPETKHISGATAMPSDDFSLRDHLNFLRRRASDLRSLIATEPALADRLRYIADQLEAQANELESGGLKRTDIA